jgi:hypothetical protein
MICKQNKFQKRLCLRHTEMAADAVFCYFRTVVFITHGLVGIKYSIIGMELDGIKPIPSYKSSSESVYVF